MKPNPQPLPCLCYAARMQRRGARIKASNATCYPSGTPNANKSAERESHPTYLSESPTTAMVLASDKISRIALSLP
ncbi:MAG TPA: hypothetical protein IGS40_07845 [Trichormus sp. M33_DOE_039]|nr:hypothetical protein [Trichormus sp. M33_DOE_039]